MSRHKQIRKTCIGCAIVSVIIRIDFWSGLINAMCCSFNKHASLKKWMTRNQDNVPHVYYSQTVISVIQLCLWSITKPNSLSYHRNVITHSLLVMGSNIKLLSSWLTDLLGGEGYVLTRLSTTFQLYLVAHWELFFNTM